MPVSPSVVLADLEDDEARAIESLPSARPTEDPIDLDDWVLHVRYARTRDPDVRDELAALYTPYARSLARRFHRSGEPFEDLFQVAMEGLLMALVRFEPERGLPFPAFATPTIVGTLKRHYRDHGWSVRVSRRVHELAPAVHETTDRLTAQLGRSPLVAEVATVLGLTVEQVLEVQEATYARATTSLDAPAGEDGSKFDLIGADDAGLSAAENRLALEAALAELSDVDREVVRLYFAEELTQTEIGARLGFSQMQVSRLLAQAVRRLRSRIVPTD